MHLGITCKPCRHSCPIYELWHSLDYISHNLRSFRSWSYKAHVPHKNIDKLWQLIRLLAGPNTSLGEPNAEMLGKLRAVLTALTEADLERIDALRAVWKDTK